MVRENFFNGFEIVSEMPQTHKEVSMKKFSCHGRPGILDRGKSNNKKMTEKERDAAWEGMT